MKSITSGNHVEANIKQRQKDVLESSLTDTPAPMPNQLPTSSQRHPTPQRRDDEGKGTEKFPSDQLFDRTITPTGDLEPSFEEQRRDIDRIMAAVNILQQDMISLRTLVENRRPQPSRNSFSDVDIPMENITNVNCESNELDALKLDMKIMQQRIKRLEESRLEARRSSTVLGSAQTPRQPSPTSAISPSEASLNTLLFPATQTLMSSHLDGLRVPNVTAYGGHDKVNEGGPSSQGVRLARKARTFPAYKRFNRRPGTLINVLAGRGIHTLKSMPPPHISRLKGPERNIITRKSSTVGDVSTHGTKATLITGTRTPTPTISPRTVAQAQEASIGNGSCQKHHEGPEYDDELVHDIPLHSSTEKLHKPTSKNPPPSHKDQTSETAPQSPPITQRQNSMQMPPPPLPRPRTPVPSSSENTLAPASRIITTHDSKRRKTTAFEAVNNAPSGSSTEAMESRPVSGHGGQQQCLLVRIDVEKVDDGKPARFQGLEESQGTTKRGRE